MRKLLFFVVCLLFLPGCGGYNAYLQKNLPQVSAKKAEITTDIPGVLHISVSAEGLIKEGNEIVADKVEYDRLSFGAVTHVTLEGYSRTLPDE